MLSRVQGVGEVASGGCRNPEGTVGQLLSYIVIMSYVSF